MTTTTTTYRIGGSESPFLCNPCVRDINRASDITMIAFCLLIGVPIFSIGYDAIPKVLSGDSTWWKPGLFCFCPGVLLIFAGLISLVMLFSKDVTNDAGETAAVKIVRKEKLHGRGTKYWTTNEYKKMKGKSP